MKSKKKIAKKGMKLFWGGITIGIIGGIISNFWVSSYFNTFGKNFSYLLNLSMFLIVTISLSLFLFLLFKLTNETI
jgi:hypothetical protein